jgi:hypothetical protein
MISGWPETIEIPALRGVLKCSACGGRPIDMRPDWTRATDALTAVKRLIASAIERGPKMSKFSRS